MVSRLNRAMKKDARPIIRLKFLTRALNLGGADESVCCAARSRRSTGNWADVMEIRRNPWIWMGVAFCAALGPAIGVFVVFRVQSPGFRVALDATARLNLL